MELVNPHQRCGYSDSPFARIYFVILQGPETDLREWKWCVHTHKNIKPYQKDTCFLWKKCFEDARQDEKHVPDLLEAIIQPPDLVKEELRQKLFKMVQINSKITKTMVSKFWISEMQSFPAGGQHNLLAQ